MSPQKTKHEVVCEFRCAEILRAARKIFAREGFDAATVDAIAEAAGLAKGTIYFYFRSKRELYLAALKQGIAALIETTRRSVDAAILPREKIRAFIATQVQFAEDNQESVALNYSGCGNGAPACFQRELKNLYLEQARLVESVLREAVHQGRIRAVRPDAVAFFICDLTRALIAERLRGWARASAGEGIECLLDLIWNGLGVPHSPNCQGETPCGTAQ